MNSRPIPEVVQVQVMHVHHVLVKATAWVQALSILGTVQTF